MMERVTSVSTLLFCIVGTNLLLSSPVSCDESYKIVCYLGSWANYRNGNGKFLIENIDPTLCTHLIYAFAKLGPDNRIAAYDPYLDLKENWGLGAFERFNGLKKRTPGLKTLIAIGGWNEGSIKYSQMAKNPSSRKIFIDSAVDFILHHGFDGLDMDWEYPAHRGGSPEDKPNFTLLLKELKEAFRPHGLILSAAVSAGFYTIHTAYEVPSVAKYLDFINVMTYDFHGAWENKIGHNSPLYPRPEDNEEDKRLNVDYAVKLWILLGAPPKKIILGMPLYGRSFTLQDPKRTDIGSPANGGGQPGPYTGESGMMGFNEICAMLQNDNGWRIVIDSHYKAPYAFKDRQWIGYDDIESIAAKVNYIKKMNLGGGMVWSVETDDFTGKCEKYKYPLLTTIKMGLQGTRPEMNTEMPTSPPRRTTEFISTVVFTPPNVVSSTKDDTKDTFTCRKEGYFRHPNDCKKFYMCTSNLYGGYDAYLYTCPSGTVFSEAILACIFPDGVPECQNE